MNRIPILRWVSLNPFASESEVCARLSRLLLILAAIEVVTMPLTQQFWVWDRFLHGGQDFELGLLTIVTCVCLVLLHAQIRGECLDLFLTMRRLLRDAFHHDQRSLLLYHSLPRPSLRAPLSGAAAGLYCTPLQI